MSHLLLIESWVEGTGRLLPSAILAAGHRYTFVTRRVEQYGSEGTVPHPVVENASEVLRLETNDEASLVEALRRYHELDPFHGALTICDYYLETVARVAAALGIVHPFSTNVGLERSKDRVRRALDEAGLANPRYVVVRSVAEARRAAAQIGYPLVSKPTDLASSAHVRLVRNADELEIAVAALQRFGRNFRDQPRGVECLLEEYLQGPEVSVEACTVDGATTVLGVTDKGVTGSPYFIEDSHMFPTALPSDTVRELDTFARRVLDAVGHDRGPAHIEVKLTSDGPRLVELNSRLPGNYIVELVRLVTGVDLLRVTLELALGERPKLTLAAGEAKSAAIRFFVPSQSGVLRSTIGVKTLAEDPRVARWQLDAKPGTRVGEPIDNGCYLGHLVAIDRDGAMAGQFAERAARRLEVSYED